MDLDAIEWVGLLSADRGPSRESVVGVTRFRKTVRVPKEAWRRHFADVGGLGLVAGDEIELTPAIDGGPRLALPDWAVAQLGVGSGDVLCITERDGRYYLKALELAERQTEIPGCTVVDVFGDMTVRRTYANRPDIDAIQPEDLRSILSEMGSLRHDPFAPLIDVEGYVGLLARREFRGGWDADDLEMAETLMEEVVAEQTENGSWGNDVLETADRVIRLLELGVTATHPAIESAVEWLLALPEPVGLPGMYLVSEKLAKRFNQWKTKPGAKGRPHRRESKGELTRFWERVAYVHNYAHDACELRLTWTSALVLEALLRCGLHEEPRVRRALNTLVALSGHGGWCGCGYLDAKVDVPASGQPIDLNQFDVPLENSAHHTDWFPGERDILAIVCGGGRSGYDGTYWAMEAGGRQALLVKSWHSTGLCSMVMHRALSYHPDYAGSRLELLGALRLAYVQSAAGTWGETVYLSSMLGFLSRSTHPLAAFLVLRSIPLLIRTQRPDGMWAESPLRQEREALPVPSAEESSLLILRALGRFGYLEALWPKGRAMG